MINDNQSYFETGGDGGLFGVCSELTSKLCHPYCCPLLCRRPPRLYLHHYILQYTQTDSQHSTVYANGLSFII